MHSTPAALDEFDAKFVADELAALCQDANAGRTIVYHSIGPKTFDAASGTTNAKDTAIPMRCYRGGETSQKEPGADIGGMKYIVLVSEFGTLAPKAGDWFEDASERWRITLVQFGDVGPERVYYLFDVQSVKS